MKNLRNHPRYHIGLIMTLVVGLIWAMAPAGYSRNGSKPSELTSQYDTAKVKRLPVSRVPLVAPLVSKSILIYGPSLDTNASPNERSLAQAAGYIVTVVDEATWAGMTTAQFAAFDAILFGDPSCVEGTDLFATADGTKSVWSRAITGPVYVQGTDSVFHEFNDDPVVDEATQTLITDGIHFAASGPGTGLYVSLSCYYWDFPSADTPINFLSGIGDFKVSGIEEACAQTVTIVKPTHPAMAGLTDASLSNWGCSAHEFVTSFPSTLEVLATALRPSDGVSLPYIIASVPRTNPIDDAGTFVRQHYLDFLNREPDTSGLVFWTNEITECGTTSECIEAKRINVSAAFFLSIEFQQTGYLVYRMYKASYGNLPGAPVPLRFSEFLPDTQEIGQGVIVNQAGWETVLENNKQAFSAEFVQRSRFMSAYPTSLTPGQFVDQLFMNASVTPSATDRTAAINEFGSATMTTDTAARARALRRVAENSTFAQQEFNRAFVLMQYFGYLRRNPNDAPEPTLDFQGYNFWLNKLNQFGGNFVNAEMVKAFLVSTEYRERFGP